MFYNLHIPNVYSDEVKGGTFLGYFTAILKLLESLNEEQLKNVYSFIRGMID